NNSMPPVSTISRTMLRNADKHNLPGNFVEGLGVIQNRCEHMIQFIASYTKIAQLPAPNRQPVVIKSLIDNCTALFAQRTFEVIGDMSEKVFCDPGQIQQVLINLLKNADDAMSETPAAIVIEAKKVQKQWVLTITDQGCGIANPDNLFVPFYTTKSSGSGIGLMLSQQIVNNHFGRLTLENRQDENGAVARIVLPFE
ncbi:MAG: HAMP domain-containing histidine kinase, partial [Psychrosphaera sp.]|nr:HAMP domain-containing histidine kinase [Psychrosphaera sp.]